MRGRVLVSIAGIAVSVIAGWVAVSGIDLAHVGDILAQVQPAYLVVALVVIGGQLVVRSFRWSLLLPRGQLGRVQARRLVPLLLIGYLGNAVLPARLGDVSRAVLVTRRERIPIAAALGTVVLERVLDTLVLAALVLPVAIAAGAGSGMVQAAAIASTAAGAVFLAARTPLPGWVLDGVRRRTGSAPLRRLLDHGGRFAKVMDSRRRERLFAKVFALTVVTWMLDASTYWLSARGLGIDLSPAVAFIVAAVAVLGTALPSAAGYVGTFELAASGMARTFGVEPAAALAFAILVHVVSVVPVAIAGAISLMWLGVRPAELGGGLAEDARIASLPADAVVQ